MSHLAEVRTIYETNARSIADMLREAAGNLDKEEENHTIAMVAVQFTQDGLVEVYGWGDTDNARAVGLLQMGAAKVCQIQLSEPEE